MKVSNRFVAIALRPRSPDEVTLDFKITGKTITITRDELRHLYVMMAQMNDTMAGGKG